MVEEEDGSDGVLQQPGVAGRYAPSSTIFIVQGMTGEYSDRSEWLVRAHLTLEAAQADVEDLTTRLAEIVGGVTSVPFEHRRAIAEAMEAYDPNFQFDYTGTSWFVCECPLLTDGAARVQTTPAAMNNGLNTKEPN